MALPADFQERLAEKTEEELYAMLAHRDDYLPEAFDAARAELARRNLSPERVEQLQAVAEAQKSQENKVAEEGLSKWVIATIFIGLAPFAFFAIYYSNKGARRKVRQCWFWAICGALFWALVRILNW